MTWGRKKPHNPSSPPSSSSSSRTFMSHILPVSWLSKLKQKKSTQEVKPREVNEKEKKCSPCIQSPNYAGGNGDLFSSRDDVDFWKLSLGEDDFNAKNREANLRSVWYSSEGDHELPPSSCKSCRSKCPEFKGNEEIQNLNDMVSRMTRRRRRRREAPREVKLLRRECGNESRTPRSRYRENSNLMNLGKQKQVWEKKGLKPQRETDKAKRRTGKWVGENILEVEEDSGVWKRESDKTKLTYSRKHHNVPSIKTRNSNLGTIEENCVFSSMRAEEGDGVGMVGNEIDSEWERMKELKIEELKSRNERQKKTVHLRRELNEKSPKCKRKVRVYSPRTATKLEICKIKALEDMKKAKLKMKKKIKQTTVEAETDLESFAVVKCSFDPQQDFRDSMVEMIMEKKISKAEELEELLACYLTLNSDQYHDLIIKVFRQVWFDLNQASFNTELENQFSCSEQLFS